MDENLLKRRIAAMVAITGRVRPALDYLEISRAQYREFRTDPAFRRLITKAKARFELQAARCLKNAAKDDYRAAIKLLQSRLPQHYRGKPVRIEGLREIPTTTIIGVDPDIVVGAKVK